MVQGNIFLWVKEMDVLAHERRFVLDPLIELLGAQFELPGQGALGQLQAQCADQEIRVLCEFPGC